VAVPRAGLYARVSTLDRQDPDMQLGELRALAERRGWKIAGEYVDHGYSGLDPLRPQRIHLLEAVFAGKLDVVAVWRLDRFGRSLADLVSVLEQIERAHIEFVSLREQLDFSTAAGRLQFHIISAFAQFEHDLISERVRAGLNAARARGAKLGRPKKPVDAAAILEDHVRGFSLRQIGRLHGISHSTVLQILHNQAGKKV